MSNRIRRTTVEVRRLSSAEAEVWVVAEVETVTPATELRGRLVGPRCPGTSTVEVPYPFRPPPRPSPSPPPAAGEGRVGGAGTLTVRVLIPEPNLWTAQTPFVYEGPLELWQDGQRCDVATVSVALKLAR